MVSYDNIGRSLFDNHFERTDVAFPLEVRIGFLSSSI